MRAENRRPKVTAFQGPDLPNAAFQRSAARQPRGSARAGGRAPHLRLVPTEAPRPEPIERGTVLRLLLGFAAILGFVGLGLWVEFGALERATYLVSSLALFSLYGTATWVSEPREGEAGRGR